MSFAKGSGLVALSALWIFASVACVGTTTTSTSNIEPPPPPPPFKGNDSFDPSGPGTPPGPGSSGGPGSIVEGPNGTITQVSVGWLHSCAVFSNGSAYCWGDNSSGDLGDGTAQESHLPVRVALTDIAEIGAGNDHTCARTNSGDVYCWGNKNYLGIDAVQESFKPVKVPLKNATHLAAGTDFTCASTVDTVYCWGNNNLGQLGRGETSGSERTPDVIKNRLANVKSMHASMSTICVVSATNDAFCWGGATYETNGPSYYNSAPTRINASDVADVVVGEGHVCTLSKAGAVQCLGEGNYGQLGDGQQFRSATMVVPTGFAGTPVKGLAAGGTHTCAVLSTGAMKCWGDGTHGRLGSGDEKIRKEPVDAKDLTSVDHVVAGIANTCAWNDSANSIYCWGYNTHGEVGDGSVADALVPQRVRF